MQSAFADADADAVGMSPMRVTQRLKRRPFGSFYFKNSVFLLLK